MSREGYFEYEFKKPLPKNPYRIWVVTSETGAAICDIINVIRRRNSKVDIVLYPALVQGEGAYKTVIDELCASNFDENKIKIAVASRSNPSEILNLEVS